MGLSCRVFWTAWVKAMTTEDFAAIDWQGQPVDCMTCSQRELLLAGQCQPGHACIADRYAKRVDRFFKWNPSVANASLDHPYFEVRAIAAKHADVFRLAALLSDPDETVRWSAVQRLPDRYLEKLFDDPHREVRIRVANQLDPARLKCMLHDPDYYVRTVVARRLPLALLPQMRGDADRQVRIEVARRLTGPALLSMARDADAAVRVEVARRLPAGLLGSLLHDESWQVRYEVAQRIHLSALVSLLDDEDEAVREVARQRCNDSCDGEVGIEHSEESGHG